MLKLLAIAALALATSPQVPQQGVAPQARPSFVYHGLAPSDGNLGTFRIPPFPDVDGTLADYHIHLRYTFYAETITGGQNRSPFPHPGLDPNTNRAQVWLRGRDASVTTHLTQPWTNAPLMGLGTSRRIGNWGLTLPAAPLDWIPVEVWAEAYESGNDTVYWGPGSSTVGPNSNSNPPFTSDSTYPATLGSVEPGMEILMDADVGWDIPDWPVSHHYPLSTSLDMDLVLRFKWVPNADVPR